MSFIPSVVLKRLYTRDSLRNTESGVCFSLKNRLSEATLTGIFSLQLDGVEIPLRNTVLRPVGGEPRPAESITEDTPLQLPVGGILHLEMEGDPLETGNHKIQLHFGSRPYGRLKLNIEDELHHGVQPDRHIPRNPEDDYCEEIINERREFVRRHCEGELTHLSSHSFDPHLTQGNIEHFLGVAQVPIGLAGPLQVNGEHADGEFFIPMATTEGTLVASYNRGMKLLNESGGVTCTVVGDNMQRAPVFVFDNARGGRRFVDWVNNSIEEIRSVAEATSRVAKLKHVDYYLSNRFAYLRFNFTTGDAAGQNMVGRATFAACNWILENYQRGEIRRFFLESNFATDKKASMINVMRTRGKRVTAEALIPRQVMKDLMGVDTTVLAYHNQVANIGSTLSGANNNGLHSANAITALFIATGQDVANVAESSAALIYTELTEENDLYFSITLPSLIVATYGGGTGLPTQRECLEMMDAYGKDKVMKLTEIVAGTVLAGELSLAAAISSLDWVSSHEALGRNR